MMLLYPISQWCNTQFSLFQSFSNCVEFVVMFHKMLLMLQQFYFQVVAIATWVSNGFHLFGRTSSTSTAELQTYLRELQVTQEKLKSGNALCNRPFNFVYTKSGDNVKNLKKRPLECPWFTSKQITNCMTPYKLELCIVTDKQINLFSTRDEQIKE